MRHYTCLLLLLVILTGCSLFEKEKEIVAQVDDEILTMEEFKSNFTEAEWKNLSAEQKKEYAEQWVQIVLLAKEAEQQGLQDEDVVRYRMKYARRKVLANALIASRLASEKVTEDEMFNYYRIHQGEFAQPLKNYRVQRIFLTDPALLSRVRAEISAGMKFEDAARLYSQEALGQNGGYMGVVTPDGPDSTIWQAVHNLKLNELTTLQKDGGLYLLRYYLEEEGKGESGFEGMKDEITRRILEERRKQVYDDLLRELKSRADIYLMI
jgi:peptidyl-prolyl cis-trans isomerase C